MQDILEGAIITVAAVNASTPAESLFDEGGRSSRRHYQDDPKFGREVWRRIGRTLQEELLSTRLLTFETNELAWRCKQSRRCECTDWEDFDGGIDWAQDVYDTVQDLYKKWRDDVVEAYSHRYLSHPSDRLLAISGLAARYSQQLHDLGQGQSYVCGMWERDLLASLCWTLHDKFSAKDSSTSDLYIAPSWSWASTNGPVEYRRSIIMKNPQFAGVVVEDVRYELSSSDPFGSIESASLTLRARVLEVDLHVPWETNTVVSFSLDTVSGRAPFLQINFDPSRHVNSSEVEIGVGYMYPSALIGDIYRQALRFLPFNSIPDAGNCISCCQCGSGPMGSIKKVCVSCGHNMCDGCETADTMMTENDDLHGLLVLLMPDKKTYRRVGYLAQNEPLWRTGDLAGGRIRWTMDDLGGPQSITIL
ncbi:hypothetical protein FKW77_005033 [Venturia effusa]|uniref:Uncharacterized protein n=1 Tax=Venturia effusa TaxID=50376 RepID=A0A517LFF3_9PEZI|nr:hypothetical protein FKW77_005033 [Venturia effusa]